MHKLRLILSALQFILFALVFGVLLFERIDLQAIALLVALVLCLIFLGFKRTFNQLKVILPFALSLIFIYMLLILFGIAPQGHSALRYWLSYGSPRLLLLISSLLVFRLCVAQNHYEGVLLSLGHIRYQKYLILGKILYQAAFQSISQIRYWQKMIPSNQHRKSTFGSAYKQALALSLALALHIMEEAKTKGEMIDNRIESCHKPHWQHKIKIEGEIK